MRVVSDMRDERRFSLTSAILIYESEARADGGALATVHDVWNPGVAAQPSGTGPELGPGRLVRRDVLEGVARKLSGQAGVRQVLPANVLCQDGARMAWWLPAHVGPIFFGTRDDKFHKAMEGHCVSHPPLLFMAEPGRLTALALQGDARPAGDTALFRAPYFNLYSDGHMCTGNVRLPDTLTPADIPAWERSLFETTFTHSNCGSVTNFPGGHTALWVAMRVPRGRKAAAPPRFPVESLIPLKTTVQEALNR